MIEKLSRIQAALKAPKNQRNDFGKYNYRSCEDILEAVKPLLAKEGLVLTITDSVEMIGNRYYVKATATVTDGEKSISTTAFARESDDKKGMDAAQITGASSSYSRKYALNGLFCIDDTKDADTMKPEEEKPAQKAKQKKDNRAEYMAKIKEAMQTQHISADDGKAICRMKFGAKSTADLNDSELKDLAENIVNYAVELFGDDDKLMEGV